MYTEIPTLAGHKTGNPKVLVLKLNDFSWAEFQERQVPECLIASQGPCLLRNHGGDTGEVRLADEREAMVAGAILFKTGFSSVLSASRQ